MEPNDLYILFLEKRSSRDSSVIYLEFGIHQRAKVRVTIKNYSFLSYTMIIQESKILSE